MWRAYHSVFVTARVSRVSPSPLLFRSRSSLVVYMEGDALQLFIKVAIVGYMLICLAIGFFLGRRSNRFEHGHITCALVSLN